MRLGFVDFPLLGKQAATVDLAADPSSQRDILSVFRACVARQRLPNHGTDDSVRIGVIAPPASTTGTPRGRVRP